MFLFVPEVASRGERCIGCNSDKCNDILDTLIMTQQAHNRESLAGTLRQDELTTERASFLQQQREIGCAFDDEQITRLFAEIAGDTELQEIANETLNMGLA